MPGIKMGDHLADGDKSANKEHVATENEDLKGEKVHNYHVHHTSLKRTIQNLL